MSTRKSLLSELKPIAKQQRHLFLNPTGHLGLMPSTFLTVFPFTHIKVEAFRIDFNLKATFSSALLFAANFTLAFSS